MMMMMVMMTMMMIKWDNHLCVIEFSGVSSNEAQGAAEVIELFQTTIDCQHHPHDADADDEDADDDADDYDTGTNMMFI